MDERLIGRTRTALKWFFGIGFIVGGADKVLNILADWSGYVSPVFEALLPISPDAFMWLVAVLEIALGILLLTRWAKTAAYVAAAWLVAIAINLATGGWYDIAVRDVMIAAGLWAYGRMTAALD